MTVTLQTLLRNAWDTVRSPREGAAWVMTFDIPRAERWLLLFLITVLSVILAHISGLLLFSQTDMFMGQILASPFISTILQMSVLVITVFLVFWMGRAMGGQGGFGDTILLVAWLQFIMGCLQVIQLIAMLTIPAFGSLLGVVGLVLFFWLLTNFVAELHGFQSLGQVFAMVIVGVIAIGFCMIFLFALIGVSITGV